MDERGIAGRLNEQRELDRILSSKSPEFIALYGRRRVGKTYLVRQFFEGRTLFFELTGRADGTLAQHMELFKESLERSFELPPVARPGSWHEAFLALQRAMEGRRKRQGKVVLFFDELPWLATRRSGCLHELEHFWNTWACRRPEVILIVCGSAASWMLQRVIHARGGLHNRLTHTMRLLPFTLSEARAYLETRGLRWSLHEVLEAYLALGGVPHYLRLLRRGESVAQGLNHLCFQPASPLRNELEEVYASLFDEGDAHRALVEVLAKRRGGVPVKDALETAKISSGGGAKRIITALEEAGFITSYVPFGRHSRDRLLRVTDEMSLFALRWLRSGRATDWVQIRGTAPWRAWAGLAFEAVCMKHVDAIRRALGISGVHVEASPWARVGREDQHGAQIDLLLDRADHVISVCEMKYTEEPFAIDRRYAEDLRRKLGVFRNESKTRKALRLVLVSARGLRPTRWSEELVDSVVTAEDLFA